MSQYGTPEMGKFIHHFKDSLVSCSGATQGSPIFPSAVPNFTENNLKILGTDASKNQAIYIKLYF